MQGFNGSERCPRDTRITQLVFPVLYTAVFLTGFLLNAVALWAFLHVPSSSTFIIYLKNTLVADLIMTLMLPFKILSDSHLGPWQLRAFVCRFSSVVFYETMYVGMVLLGLIAFDRFLKIIRPFGKSFVKKPAFAKMVSILVWLVLFLISLPNMILNNREATPVSVRKCASLKGPLGLKWHRVVNYISQFIFWTVFVLMLLFYVVIARKVYSSYKKFRSKDHKSHKRLEGKVFVVVAVFFVCFAPFHFARVPYTHSQTHNKTNCKLENQLFITKETTLFLAATNICLDPLIYIFLCKKFTERLPCMRGRRTPASSQEHQSSQTDNFTLG
ncbi:P2Y purinoceptor 13 [Castor canadensis]|jgi:purinergic receptor P2Y G protein-coupled protein 13|uniref:P2Y purinoceptor 13 n=1 Tax=Castor canadensis TaxID=51338 RepID=A0A250YFM7_CASCN|nr:P2Y purinoceptor 13 [Castor canadensis]XP_020039423.1 P2Y purinoceptor 13 [Castor canadensis]